jgi:hypothetical protein
MEGSFSIPSSHVYIYLNPLGHILKSFASLESEFGIRSKERGGSKIGSGKSRNASINSRLVSEGSKTLPLIYRRYQNNIRSNKFIYCKSRIRRKVRPGARITLGGAPWA